jgi:hypothetical protein
MLTIKIKKGALRETRGEGGAEYERTVHAALVKAAIPGFDPGEKPVGGYNNHTIGDIEAKFNGEPFYVEVKKSIKAQMGSGQVVYNRETGEVKPHPTLLETAGEDDLEILLDAARKKIPSMEEYLRRYDEITGTTASGLPLLMKREVREQLKNEGELKKTNATVVGDSRYIIKHYNKKGVYYIQIGGAGLFYLNENPFNLPIPAFQGKAQVEMRLKPAGSYAVKSKGGERYSRVEWSLLGRLLSNVKSPYTLDDPESARELFAKIASGENTQQAQAAQPQNPETQDIES